MHIPAILFIILFIPAMIALGHDIYLFQQELRPNQIITTDMIMKDLKFADLGFIIANYSPGTLKILADSMSEENFNIVQIFLKIKAVHLGLGFGGLFFTLFVILGLVGVGPFKKPDKTAKRKKLEF